MKHAITLLFVVACAPATAQIDLQEDPDTSEPTDGREWTAQWLIGGLDGIVVWGERDAEPSCVAIRLVAPAYDGSPYNELSINEPWGMEAAGSSSSACATQDPWEMPTDPASDIAGSITVEGAFLPQAVQFNVELSLGDGTVEQIDTRVVVDGG